MSIKRYTVQHIHKRKNKQITVVAKDPKQAMRSVIHREHGGYPDLITWRKMYAYENVIHSGDFKINGREFSVCVAYIPGSDDPEMGKGEYGLSGYEKEVNDEQHN